MDSHSLAQRACCEQHARRPARRLAPALRREFPSMYNALMGLAQRIAEHEGRPAEDAIVLLPNATWADYQRQLEMRGDKSAPRIAFLEGTIEIVSPSRTHEEIKSLIGRLVEVWCLEKNIDFQTLGAWTLENKEAPIALRSRRLLRAPPKTSSPLAHAASSVARRPQWRRRRTVRTQSGCRCFVASCPLPRV